VYNAETWTLKEQEKKPDILDMPVLRRILGVSLVSETENKMRTLKKLDY